MSIYVYGIIRLQCISIFPMLFIRVYNKAMLGIIIGFNDKDSLFDTVNEVQCLRFNCKLY